MCVRTGLLLQILLGVRFIHHCSSQSYAAIPSTAWDTPWGGAVCEAELDPELVITLS